MTLIIANISNIHFRLLLTSIAYYYSIRGNKKKGIIGLSTEDVNHGIF